MRAIRKHLIQAKSIMASGTLQCSMTSRTNGTHCQPAATASKALVKGRRPHMSGRLRRLL